jgi:hypothetical protein
MSVNKDNPLHNPFHTIDEKTKGFASFIPGYDIAAYPGRFANSIARMASGKQSVGAGLADIGMNTGWAALSAFDLSAVAKLAKGSKAIEVGEELPKVAEYAPKSGGRIGAKLKTGAKVGAVIGGGIAGSIGQAYLHQKDEAGRTIQQDIDEDKEIRKRFAAKLGKKPAKQGLQMSAADKYHQSLKFNKKRGDAALLGKPGDSCSARRALGITKYNVELGGVRYPSKDIEISDQDLGHAYA